MSAPFIRLLVEKILCGISIVFLLCSCSQEILDRYGYSDEDDFELLGKKTIGAAGGELAGDQVKLTIPEGSLDQDCELGLWINTSDTAFGKHAVSPTYRVTGLPDQINQPLRISLSYSGTIDGDPTVALSMPGYANSLDTTLWSFQGQPASMNQGSVTFDFPGDRMKTGQFLNLPEAFGFLLLNGYTTQESAKGHFTLTYPMLEYAHAVQLAEIMESVYDTCIRMGFDLRPRTSPLPVMVKAIPAYGYYTRYITDPAKPTDAAIRDALNWGHFTINQHVLPDQIELPLTASHEFLHFVQNVYEFSSPWAEPHQAWLTEATSVWFESKFSPDPFYESVVINGREHYALLGMQSDSAAHGYGTSFIIADLVQQKGEGAVLRIFEKIRDGVIPGSTVDPVQAIVEEINQSPKRYWQELLGAYMEGSFYAHQVSRRLANLAASYTLNTYINRTQIRVTNQSDYQDFSARLFGLNPADPGGWQPTDKIGFTMDKPADAGIMVFKLIPGGDLHLLAEVFPGENGQVLVGDLQTLMNEGAMLVALVVSVMNQADYTAKQQIELVMELNPQEKPKEGIHLVVPSAIDLSYWEYLWFMNGGSSDTIFMIGVDTMPEYGVYPYIFNKRTNSWWLNDCLGCLGLPDTLAMQGWRFESYFPDLEPEMTDTMLIRIESDLGADTAAVAIRILPLFDGFTAWSHLHSYMDPVGYQVGGCFRRQMDFSLSGHSLTGSFSKSYHCADEDPNSRDTTRWYTTNSSVSLTSSGLHVSGGGTLVSEVTYQNREWANEYDHAFDEEYSTTTFQVNGLIQSPSSYLEGSSVPGARVISFSLSGISATTNIRRVMYRHNKPDSVMTETKTYSDQWSGVRMLGVFNR